MVTDTALQNIPLAIINDNSPVLNLICKELTNSVYNLVFQTDNIEEGLTQLSMLKTVPEVCIIDIDFYDKNILVQLQELKTKHPTMKLIAHSDIDNNKVVKSLLDIGFMGYLLIGSDADDFKNAIESVSNDRRYFSMGVAKTAQKYFSSEV